MKWKSFRIDKDIGSLICPVVKSINENDRNINCNENAQNVYA